MEIKLQGMSYMLTKFIQGSFPRPTMVRYWLKYVATVVVTLAYILELYICTYVACILFTAAAYLFGACRRQRWECAKLYVTLRQIARFKISLPTCAS